jgi:Arc/MetJ-type ribon-helix-helix transcriptional regulator
MPHKQKTTYNFGVSLPVHLVDKIDIQRGKYISRSSWILLAIESLTEQTERRKVKSVQPDLVGRHDQADGRVSTQTPMEPMIDHE